MLHVGSLMSRTFTAHEAALLQLAADRAAAAVQSMTARADRIAAVTLQRSLLPSALPPVQAPSSQPGSSPAGRGSAATGMTYSRCPQASWDW